MKKLLFLMCALLLGVSGAWAQITVSPSTGVYWKNGAVSSDAWAPQWKSNAKAIDGTTPLLVFTGETGMNTANGDIYSNQSYTLEAPSGYVIVGYTFNGTATGGDVIITPTGVSGTTISSGNSLGSPLDITVAAQSTSFALSGDGHITNLSLIVEVEHYVVSYSTSTGSYTATNPGGTWASRWVSTATDPQVTLSVGANNIAVSTGYLYSGASGCTYTLTAQDDYIITGYEIVGTAQSGAQTLTPAAGGSATQFATSGTTILKVTGLSSQSTSFQQSTPNSGIAISSFKIFLENSSAVVTYVISDENGVVFTSEPLLDKVGGTISTLPSAFQRDYCNYTVTPKTIEEGDNTVEVSVAYNLPFESGTGKLYYAKLRGHYAYYDATNNDVRTNQSSKENTLNYKWSFSGNPYTGIKMRNEATGTYLDNTSGTVQLTTEGYAWTIHSLNGTTTFGLYNGSNYINEQNHTNHNLIYWYQFTNDAGSQWVIEEVPATTVDVTYELWVGGVKVNTIVDEGVAANSDVNVPATLTTGYSTLAYDFATSGTIGEEDCTIIVTATLKSGVVTDINQLSNGKAYTLTTERGSLGTNGTQMVSSFGTSYSASNFAIINYENNYYLYSIVDSKWVGNPTTVNGIANQPALTEDLNSVTAISFDTTNTTIASPLFFMAYGSNGVNVSNYSTGIVVNSWTTRDPGNQYCIFEVDDFDATEALAALEEHFHPAAEALFNDAIATLEAINFGTGLNQYSFTGSYAGYTSQAATIIEGLKSQGYSEDNLAAAQALLANYALNMPATGKFYRIQGYSGNYITSNTAGSNASMNGTASVNNIVYYSAEKNLVFFGGGFGLYNTSIVAPAGSSLNAYDFMEGAQKGHYYVKSNASGMGTYCYDNTANGTKVDRNGSPVTSGSYQTDWTLEEITTLPVTISSAGYATLYSPVALEIPEGVKAYVAVDEGKYLHLDAIEDGVIPAETGVVLAGEKGSYDFAITTGGTAKSELTGTLAAISRPADSYILATGANDVAFYKDGATTIPGFKAYLIADGGGTVKTFIFGGETEVKAIEAAQNAGKVVYDLSGRRVKNPAKGVYIVNGKKVLF